MSLVFQISFYVPEKNLEAVKTAMFNAGAGKFNNYQNCAWQTMGKGQFKPSHTANPSIGNKEQINYVDEYKVEMICVEDRLKQVISALKASHPYEEVAYSVLKMESM